MKREGGAQITWYDCEKCHLVSTKGTKVTFSYLSLTRKGFTKFGQISEVQFSYTELEALVVTQLAVRNWNCEQVQNLCKLVAGTYSSQSLLVLFALLGSFSTLVLFLRLLAPMRTNSSVLVSTSEIALEIRHSLLYLKINDLCQRGKIPRKMAISTTGAFQSPVGVDPCPVN